MASCRFAFAIHILAMLAYKGGEDVTSERLAQSINTNPVVVRRLLATLRRAGLITTHKGAGGGARLSRPPEKISLAEVYCAVTETRRFSAHPHQPNQRCPVGRRIEEVLHQVFTSAQDALEAALAARTLADVMETVAEPASRPTAPALA